MWSLCSCFLSFARGLPAAKSCGPDYSPHLRPLEQPSFALKHTHTDVHAHTHTHTHTHTHNRYRITCVRYVILLTRSTGNSEHLCLLLFSLLFSLSFPACFCFFCRPLFCSQEVVWCDEGLTGPVVLYSLLCSLALAPDLTAGLLSSRLVSSEGRATETVTQSIQINFEAEDTNFLCMWTSFKGQLLQNHISVFCSFIEKLENTFLHHCLLRSKSSIRKKNSLHWFPPS